MQSAAGTEMSDEAIAPLLSMLGPLLMVVSARSDGQCSSSGDNKGCGSGGDNGGGSSSGSASAAGIEKGSTPRSNRSDGKKQEPPSPSSSPIIKVALTCTAPEKSHPHKKRESAAAGM